MLNGIQMFLLGTFIQPGMQCSVVYGTEHIVQIIFNSVSRGEGRKT